MMVLSRRVGEEHEVKVDVRNNLCNTKNLWELVQKGLFREDLYYRLNVLTLTPTTVAGKKSGYHAVSTAFY